MRGITIYSKISGIEILANDREKRNNKYGVITLRFFKLDGNSTLRFILTPIESFGVSNFVKSLITATSSAKKVLTHKFTKNDNETTSTLTLEKWEKEGRVGYAVSIKRDNISINVPMDTNTFCYLSELFRYLSVQQAWVNPIETNETVEEEIFTDFESKDFEEGTINEVPTDFRDGEVEIEKAFTETQKKEKTTETKKVVRGIIDAVRKDLKGFKVGNAWYMLNDNSQVNAKLEKGKKVSLTYITENNKNYVDTLTNQ